MLPNRVATYAAALAALCAAVVPVLADLDWTSTVGVIGGVGILAAVVYKWLDGWQKYEERTALEPLLEQQAGANVIPGSGEVGAGGGVSGTDPLPQGSGPQPTTRRVP